MSKKYLVAGFLAAVVGIFTLMAIFNVPNQTAKQDNASTKIDFLSLSSVKNHNTNDDCWTIIEDKVYDITKYLPVHPGGPVISKACGTDGTELFNTKGDSGSKHSSFAKNLLADYLLGPLSVAATDPPVATITSPAANQQLDSGTTQVIFSVTTDKASTCKWDTSSKSYSTMANTFTTTGSTTHSQTLISLTDGSSYTRYVRCKDTSGNEMTTSVSVTFKVKAAVVPPISGYTAADVAAHNSAASCWLIINNMVYDVTNYINVHPGGRTRILNYCGQEATTAFDTRGGSESHSNTARNLLAGFYIGDLSGAGGSGSNTPPSQTKTINVNSAGIYNPTTLTISVGDTVTFVYTAPIDNEVKTTFSPAGISSITLDQEYTQRTKTFNTAGTWTYKAADHNGNTGTLIVQ